ncbi:MAG: alkaline phosphatase, partial [Gammaproteobacteria bacterium]|nr:alkaline phosphatase [Gammaproteobacteria bacterium]
MKPLSLRQVLVGLSVCTISLLTACSPIAAQQEAPADRAEVSAAKNVILFIGDGMGVSTVTAIRIFDGQQKGMLGEENVLPFERFPHIALSKTYSVNQQVGESAGTATAMMTGQKTRAGFIGISSKATRGNCASSKDHHLPSLLELSESAGKSTGIVTTTRLTHATPAATYAHVPERDWENDADLTEEARLNGCKDIAAQLIEFPYGDGIEVALGGGRNEFLPHEVADPEGADTEEGRLDNRNLAQEWVDKYPNSAYVWNRKQFEAIDSGSTDHLLGLFQNKHMQFEADRAEDVAGEPSLAQMTKLAIGILERNPNGYFLMVEGGRIDHAHHDNNAYRALTDGIAFADAVQVADEMTDEGDTLIIVTADHSHTFVIGGYPTRGNPMLGKVITNNSRGEANSSHATMDDGKPFTTLGYMVGPGGAWVGGPRPDLSEVDTGGDKDFIQQAGLPAEDDTHAGEDVAVYARGPGAERIHGVIEQNEIFNAMG